MNRKHQEQPSLFGDPEPAPFAAGSAARRAGNDLDGSRQERVLLGALIERPALLHILAEDLAALPIVSSTGVSAS